MRIAGGCALVDYVALDGRSVAEVRGLLADQPDVFAVGEPLRGITSLHDDGAHFGYGPGSGAHYDDGAGEQWHLPTDYMEELWDGWKDDNPVVVAVIDSGFDGDHPDLVNQIVDGGLRPCHREFGGRTDTHGTHVAGIVAAERGNSYGVSGVAPDAQVLPIRNSGCGVTPMVAVELALRRAYVGVINMSFGVRFTVERTESCAGSSPGTPSGLDAWQLKSAKKLPLRDRIFELSANCDSFRQMLNIAAELGVVTVAAAGNSGHCRGVYDAWIEELETNSKAEISDDHWCKALDPDTGNSVETPHTFYLPAGYSNTIAVANIDIRGNREDSSNQNSYNSVAAPGTDITSTFPVDPRFGADKAFGIQSGTSMAAPFVAGVVAHMLNRYPEATPAQVRRALQNTAADRGLPRRDDQYGHGIVRPREAIFRLREILGLHRFNDIRVSAAVCAPDDDTAGCPDPALLRLRATSGRASRTPRRYSVEVPSNASYMSVEFDYEADGRPLEPYGFPPDSERSLAGHQFVFPTHADRTQLTISLYDWKGDPYLSPYVFTFTRVGSDETGPEPASSPELASLGVWDRSCGPGLSSGPHVCPSGSGAAIAPGFDPAVRSYSVTVPRGTQLVTIDRAAAAGFELGEASPPDADPLTPGYQVRLAAPVSVPQSDRADKPATSAAVGERFLEVVGSNWSGAVIIASAENFPDGLAAASLAGTLRAPILLTPRDRLHPAVAEFIRDNPVSEIVIMGGPAAISNVVQAELRRVSGLTNVPRLWGADRYETAIEIAERVVRDAGDVGQLCGTSSRAVFIATGRNSADALAASPAAYAAQMPVLLVDPKARSLHGGVADFIEDHGIDTAVILGGTSAVPARVHQQLSDLVSINRVSRVAGPDRFATAAQLARDVTSRCYDHGVEAIGLANGQGFADALAAGPLVAELNGVMLLTQPDDVPPATLDAMTQIGKEAQLTNITLALLAVGDIAQAGDEIDDALQAAGQGINASQDVLSRTVSTREFHTCALTRRGKARCWGANGYGQSNPPDDTFVAIGAGEFHSCGIKTDGSLKCWGRDWHSQINPPAGRFEQIDLHWEHSCGLRPSGAAECWGSNQFGRAAPPNEVFTDIAVALRSTCGLRPDGTITCWGVDHYGQRNPPKGVFIEIEAGDDNHCAIRADRTLACWGRDQQRQTSGHPPGTYQAVAPAHSHACAIRTDGTVVCWGRKEHGESDPPRGVFVGINTGVEHSCGVRPDGRVECWGSNERQQLDAPSDGLRVDTTGPGVGDPPPLTEDVEKIAVLASWKPTERQVSVTVVDPKRTGVAAYYQITIREERD